MPDPDSSPLDLVRRTMKNKTPTFELKPVHPDRVNKIIMELKNSSSYGLDNIPTRILKIGRAELVPAITHIVNLSITSKKFPQAWKVAKVIPLHKKEEETNPKNYRPVSLLSNVSKILEKSIHMQLNSYFENEKLLNKAHHGFRKTITPPQLTSKCKIGGLSHSIKEILQH